MGNQRDWPHFWATLYVIKHHIRCTYYLVAIYSGTSKSSALGIITSTDSTFQTENWNEIEADSGLHTEEHVTAHTDAQKSATSDEETFADFSALYAHKTTIPIVWPSRHSNHRTSENFDASTAAVTNDVASAGVSGKLQTQTSSAYSGGPVGDDLLYLLSETTTQVLDNGQTDTSLPAALISIAANYSVHDAHGTNFTEMTVPSRLRDTNHSSVPMKLPSEDVESGQLEKLPIRSTDAITTSRELSGNKGLNHKHSTTTRHTRPAAGYQLQLDSGSSSSRGSNSGRNGEENGGNVAESAVLRNPGGRTGSSLDLEPSSRDNSQHLTRSSGRRQDQRHDREHQRYRDDDDDDHDEVRSS